MDRLDLSKVMAARTQDGRDPELVKNAEKYCRSDWQFTVKGLMEALAFNEDLKDETREMFASDEFIAIVQDTMIANKYAVLEASEEKKEANKTVGRRW